MQSMGSDIEGWSVPVAENIIRELMSHASNLASVMPLWAAVILTASVI